MSEPTQPLDLTALRETANAATPGPWSWGEESKGWGDCGPNLETVERGPVYSDGSQGSLSTVVGSWGHDANGISVEDNDATHIAAFDPPTVLALLDRLQAAEAKLARVENLATKWENTVGGMSTRYAAHRIKATLDGTE